MLARLNPRHRSAQPRPRRLREILQATYQGFRSNRSIRLGAGLAYYGLFAVIPLLALSMALATVFFDDAEVNDYLTDVLQGVIGDAQPGAAEAIVKEVDAAADSLTVGLVGIAVLVFASSLLFVALQDAVNSIWDVPVRGGLRDAIVRRLRAFVVVLGAAGLVIFGLVVQGATQVMEAVVPERIEAVRASLSLVAALVSFAALAGAMALLFHELGPDHLRWRPAIIAGAATSTAMTVGSVGLAVYLSRPGGGSISGATAGVVLVLVWLYYQTQILLLGAHLVRVLDEGPVNTQADDA